MTVRRILLVDDEPHVLGALSRCLRGRFEITTAASPGDALSLVESSPPFAVVVADYRMPEMDGAELLRRVGQLSPESTRIILTGNTDQETAVEAVNRGAVFRFLNKPCDTQELIGAINAGVRHYELIVAEKEILEETLNGCIKVLAEVLSVVKPEAFGLTGRLYKRARSLAEGSPDADRWTLSAAALLSQLGCISVSDSILAKVSSGVSLTEEEAAEFASHPRVAARLIEKIPRMQNVARVIGLQQVLSTGDVGGSGTAAPGDVPVEARLINAALRLDRQDQREQQDRSDQRDERPVAGDDGSSKAVEQSHAAQSAEGSAGESGSSDVFAAADSGQPGTTRVRPGELKLGMIIEENVTNLRGAMIVARGQEVTETVRQHLLKFQRNGSVQDSILVSMPRESCEEVEQSGGESALDELKRRLEAATGTQ